MNTFNVYKRYISSFLELFIVIDLITIPILLIMEKVLGLSINTTMKILIFFIECILILFKDIKGGASLVKRMFGYKVIDHDSNETATPIKTILRNSTIILLLPIEIVFVWFSPQRRIGDYLAKTRLVEMERIAVKNGFDNSQA